MPDGVHDFTSPVPILTDNERRVFYVGMSRARERLVILENLIKGAPTLPVSVLLHNEVRDPPSSNCLTRPARRSRLTTRRLPCSSLFRNRVYLVLSRVDCAIFEM